MRKVEDHNGRIWPSVAMMCEHYGLTREIYRWRLRHGWPLDRILTTPARRYAHKNGGDVSIYSRLRERGLSRHRGAAVALIRDGFSLDEALVILLNRVKCK